MKKEKAMICKLDKARATNRYNSQVRDKYEGVRRLYAETTARIEGIELQLEQVRKELADLKDRKHQLSLSCVQLDNDVRQLQDIDEIAIVCQTIGEE
jgi:CRISPR/Cas system CSM-associated protein Csm2 small subunit